MIAKNKSKRQDHNRKFLKPNMRCFFLDHITFSQTKNYDSGDVLFILHVKRMVRPLLITSTFLFVVFYKYI
jgi:hypothetical protein